MEVFVARQPIFNVKEEVIGYELLYRSDQAVNKFANVDGDLATTELIINSFMNIGIEKLANGRPCFINFTENLLKTGLPTYFHPSEIVVEILETIEPNQELIQICTELKSKGYKIALDDIIFREKNPYFYDLLKLADIVKIDFLNTPISIRGKMETVIKKLGLKMLAEKVETRDDFEDALKKGYHFFQGFFFSKPMIMSSREVPVYFHSYYEIIQQLAAEDPNIDIITQLIERDVSLSYKLLKLINSPAYRPKQKINSIKQAIVLLGLRELKKWIYILAVRESRVKKKESSEEMIRNSLTRARMCEEIERIRSQANPSPSYFMTGMLSLMDSILGMSMETVLLDLPLDEEICDALNGKENSLKEVLYLVLAVEKAEWTKISCKCQELNIDERELFKVYAESLNWSHSLIADGKEESNALFS
jgi:c-di-GMP-related signal transduction protein